ncbi:MAG TPA: sn-glycerol-3-phosphate ABC transporter ATP-binding protein UgpC [Dongiaceae bacterium]|nr:sn-glycerol-3-phosphate ABC transporter ATP-binding protein UgpC [Dongiaceae bacterium]
MANIAIRDLRKSYGRREIVHGLDLDIANGEFVVVLGPSGCGKSTLLRMIAGLEEITSGEIAIDGRVVNRLEPRERGCAMVFQNFALYPHMTVADNIGYALKVAGVPRAERVARVAKVADTLGLTEFLDRKPAALSGGQRQRVAMGRAMIREPSVFLFDEPLSNLDAKLRGQMRVEIKRLHQRLRATSVFVTHDQVEAMTLADRLVVMNQGRIEQVGAPAEVYRRPASRFVAGFIGSPPMNFLPVRVLGPDMVALESDQRLRLRCGVGALDVGAAVVAGFRPEDMQLIPAASADAIPFATDMVEELGASKLLHGQLAGAECIAAVPSAISLSTRATLFAQIAPESIHLFDGETGTRMR